MYLNVSYLTINIYYTIHDRYTQNHPVHQSLYIFCVSNDKNEYGQIGQGKKSACQVAVLLLLFSPLQYLTLNHITSDFTEQSIPSSSLFLSLPLLSLLHCHMFHVPILTFIPSRAYFIFSFSLCLSWHCLFWFLCSLVVPLNFSEV